MDTLVKRIEQITKDFHLQLDRIQGNPRVNEPFIPEPEYRQIHAPSYKEKKSYFNDYYDIPIKKAYTFQSYIDLIEGKISTQKEKISVNILTKEKPISDLPLDIQFMYKSNKKSFSEKHLQTMLSSMEINICLMSCGIDLLNMDNSPEVIAAKHEWEKAFTSNALIDTKGSHTLQENYQTVAEKVKTLKLQIDAIADKPKETMHKKTIIPNILNVLMAGRRP